MNGDNPVFTLSACIWNVAILAQFDNAWCSMTTFYHLNNSFMPCYTIKSLTEVQIQTPRLCCTPASTSSLSMLLNARLWSIVVCPDLISEEIKVIPPRSSSNRHLLALFSKRNRFNRFHCNVYAGSPTTAILFYLNLFLVKLKYSSLR